MIRQAHFPKCVVGQSEDVPVSQSHEDTVEMTTVRFVGAGTSSTGSVKRWSKALGFSFTTPDDGGEDVHIHCKQLVGIDGLQRGESIALSPPAMSTSDANSWRVVGGWRRPHVDSGICVNCTANCRTCGTGINHPTTD